MAALITICAVMALEPVEPSAARPVAANGRIGLARDGDIWTVNADESELNNLTNSALEEWSMTFSPDGSKIAFARHNPENSTPQSAASDLWIMNSDGTQEVQVTHFQDAYTVDSPAWSPDGTMIAFARYSPQTSTDLWVMNIDGTGAMQITSDRGQETEPAWSPDGTQIAFRADVGIYWTIQLIEPDGNNRVQITPLTSNNWHASWTADGQGLIFNSDRDDSYNYEIYRMDRDGSNVVRITYNDQYDYRAIPSPDGAKIAFTRLVRDPGYNAAYVMASDGSDVTPLVDDPNSETVTWGWAPAFPTAVTITQLSARTELRGVRISWTTPQVSELAGFNIYREHGGKRLKLNRTVIPSALGVRAGDRTYSWLDRNAPKHHGALLYRLQVISLNGKRSWAGTATVGS